MNRNIKQIVFVGTASIVVVVLLVLFLFQRDNSQTSVSQSAKLTLHEDPALTLAPTATPTPPPSALVQLPQQIYQTFNNCGPATLAMYLQYLGQDASQEEIGKRLRPYQNPQGDNDDKSVSLEELADYARSLGLVTYHKPGGSIELLRSLTSHNIPVITRTWLNAQEDIGHYRIVRGYDDAAGHIIQNDSYQGVDLTFSYDEFLALWQPFQYEYLVIAEPNNKALIEKLIGAQDSNEVVWRRILVQANEQTAQEQTNPYPVFNKSVAHFYLGEYAQSVSTFESIASALPGRMLWYQTEPIEAYVQLGNLDQVIALTDSILTNNNRGYSELYQIRAEAFLRNGQPEQARNEFEQALFYNVYYEAPKRSLKKLDQ